MGEIVRLQKYIAMCGAASRRAAEELIAKGKVKVNGKIVREMGTKVEIGADEVVLSGEKLSYNDKKYYIMLNKPAGYVSTAKDQFDRPTVVELVNEDISARIVPVGRLDYETEGLLLLSNDGDFTYRVTHPKFKVDKTYIAVLKGGITISGLNKLRRGVDIGGFVTSPARVNVIKQTARSAIVEIEIHEGKNRQVRKMFAAVGNNVQELERIAIGEIRLGRTKEGHYRKLTREEIEYLKNC